MDRRWGFEEADDEDRDEGPEARAGDPGDLLTGQDADGVVTVAVNHAADVVSVRLAEGWTDPAVRRDLGVKVVEAVGAATALAVAKQAERVDLGAGEMIATGTPTAASKPPEQEERPITREDAMRLLEAVSDDLAQFRRRLSTITDRAVTEDSGGGHVTVSGRQGRVTDVSIDQDWLYGTRASEIESELRDALTRFGATSSPGELAQGPRSSAIDELLALVSDPQAMVRRIRQRPTS